MRYYSLWDYSKHRNNFASMHPKQYLKILGENIRQVRKKKGLSQEQLALQAEVDRSYVGGIERGERNVSFLTLVKIAECLGCEIELFTKGIPANVRDEDKISR